MSQSVEQAQLLRLAVDFDPTGLVVTEADETIVLVNRAVERLFGYTRQELLGQPVEILVPDRFRALRPFRAARTPPAGATAAGTSLEITLVRKDGSEVPVEIGANTVWTERGVLTFASVADISRRKEAEERFRIAVESSPSGVLMVDPRGTIVLVNREAERLFGYPRDELVGQSLEVLVAESQREAHAGLRRGFLSRPNARPMGSGTELLARRKDGVEIPVEIGLNPIHTERGTFVLSSIVDIRARRNLEAQLRQDQKMKAIGTLAGGIAHDFNNILRAIVGFTELAAAQLAGRADVRRDLDQVVAAAERGRLLVDRILAFSRQREVARLPIDLGRPVGEALDFLRASLPSSIDIVRYFDADTPSVVGDETEIHQVVLNLATNSAHAMGERGGTLRVTLSPVHVDEAMVRAHPGLRSGMHARLSVSDNGHGMPAEVIERAFDPFFTTKEPGTGTGLGLSVVHGIVTHHGGSIDIRSRPGDGTTVNIYLPAAEPAVRRTGTETQDATTPARPHILLIEDEEMLAELGQRQLEGLGYRVTAYTSSLKALADFRERPQGFDAVVTDNTMPHMTGFALAQEMIAIRPDMPILMVSGLAEGLDADTVCATGVRAVLRKPHTSAQLAEAVRQLMAAR